MRDWALCFVPNHLKTKKMYKKPIQEDPWSPVNIPNHLNTQEKC